MTAVNRSLAGRIGAHSLHAKYDGSAITQNARAGFMSKFEREVDPLGVLSSEERRRRAGHAMTAHMQRLALRSAQARAKRSAGGSPSGG